MVETWFYEGGAAMWVIALLTLPCFAFAIIHAAQPKMWSLFLTAGLAALVFLTGIGGTVFGRINVQAALEVVEPSQADQIREIGYREASRPITFAAIICALAAIPFAAGEIKRKR